MESSLLRVTAFAGELLKSVIAPGDTVVDATAGTGQDTLLLAQCTGTNGCVYAFDIQEKALEQTRERLDNKGIQSGVTLICQSHERMADVLKTQGVGNETVKAIVFNLGYLPGGDQSLVTLASTTIKALEGALTLLAPKGMITVCLYPGHSEGNQEAEAVIRWCEGLEKPYVAHHFQTLNRKSPPSLIIVQRMR